MEATVSRGTFSGKLGFILAAAGSAVGLGNLWRFPYLAEQYGGGIFLLTYLLLVFTFGITLVITEIAIGRRTGKSSIEAYRSLAEKYRVVGWISTIVPIVVLSYYCVIGGWVIKYFFEFATGGSAALATGGYFDSFITAPLGALLEGPFVWFIIYGVLSFVVVMFSIDKGVERVSKVLMPLFLIILVFICVYVLTLPGIMGGLEYYLVPDFSQFSMKTVVGALGQLFYSLSIAMGIMIAYGSYMKRDVNIAKSARSVCAMDTIVAMLCGLMVVPAVFVFSDVGMSSGPGLLFETMPLVFQSMAGGEIIGTLFFALAFFAALTSSIALAEASVSSLRDHLRISRVKSTLICAVIVFCLGVLPCFGYGPLSGFEVLGMAFLDLFDFITNSVLMPVAALLMCIIIGHLIKPPFVTDEVEGVIGSKDGTCAVTADGTEINREGFGKFPSKAVYTFMLKWFCPIGTFVILVAGLLAAFGVYTI